MLLHGAGCGGIYGGGGGGSKADVMGNILASTPAIAGRNVVVFVFRQKDEPADCEIPVLPEDGTPYESIELKDGETAFELNNVKTGRLVIALLLDEEGKDADGRIDPGDPVAVLNDPDCILDDVPDDYIAEALDVRINFGLDDVLGMPEPGRAEAGTLEEFPKD